MPQLDALTYFSQFVYLIISFIAVYVFALQVIIPKVVSAQKLRQKLNSIALVTTKLENAALNQSQFDAVEHLRSSQWQDSAKLKTAWPMSARALQMCQTLRYKKLLCALSVQPYKS